jgi:ABC-type amino acid transport substrate-binding protein
MRHACWLFTLLFAALAAAAASGDGRDRRPLRVASPGPLDAFDAELLTTFAKAQGRTVQPVTGLASSVVAGGADVAVGLFADAVTPSDLEATREVLPSRLVAVSRRPQAIATSIESLRGARIGALRGSRAITAIHDSKISGAEVSEYASLEVALSALRDDRVAFLLLELKEALIAQHEQQQLELGVFLGTRRSCVYAVRSEDRALLAELNAYLQGLRKTPSWAAIVARHYGPGVFETIARAHLAD